MSPSRNPNPKKSNRELFAFLHLGWMIALLLTVFTLGGNFLDRRFGTSPLFLLLGVLLAFLLLGYLIWREIKRISFYQPPDDTGKNA